MCVLAKTSSSGTCIIFTKYHHCRHTRGSSISLYSNIMPSSSSTLPAEFPICHGEPCIPFTISSLFFFFCCVRSLTVSTFNRVPLLIVNLGWCSRCWRFSVSACTFTYHFRHNIIMHTRIFMCKYIEYSIRIHMTFDGIHFKWMGKNIHR